MPEVKQKPDFFNTKTAISCTSLSQMLEVTRLAGFWGWHWHWYSTKAGKAPGPGLQRTWLRLIKEDGPRAISFLSDEPRNPKDTCLNWCDAAYYFNRGFTILSFDEGTALLLGSGSSPAESAPRNNDGRETCWWCRSPTRKAGGGFYDVCTAAGCGK